MKEKLKENGVIKNASNGSQHNNSKQNKKKKNKNVGTNHSKKKK